MILQWGLLNKTFLIFSCFTLLHFQGYAVESSSFNYQDALIRLSNEDKLDLHEFLYTILTEFECGYVLYGNKLICFMGYSAMGDDFVGMMKHYSSVALQNGIKTWRKLRLPLESANYILHESKNTLECNKILLINKQEFVRVVNEKLILFQYILGPQITAEKLLTKLTDPNSRKGMYSVLKNNKVLIGIVLGFGVNNALFVNRQELISEALDAHNIDPDIADSSQIDLTCPISSSLGISCGNHSILKEYKDLNQKICTPSKSLTVECPRILFGCIPTDKETRMLIDHYEDVQLKIIKVLESNNFIDKILTKFYSNEIMPSLAEADAVKKVNLSTIFTSYVGNRSPTHLSSLIHHTFPFDLASLVAHSIWHQFCSSTTLEKNADYSAFIEGMYAADQKEDALFEAYSEELRKPWSSCTSQELAYVKGYRIWAHYKIGKNLYSLKQVILALNQHQKSTECQKLLNGTIYAILNKLHQYLYRQHYQHEIEIADNFFRKSKTILSNQKNMLGKSNVPLYYLPLVQGRGGPVQENDQIKLRYIIKNSTGHVIVDSSAEGEYIDLQRTIPGLRIGLNGLRKGSKGILYLHPHWGFRDNSGQPPIRPFLQIDLEILNVPQIIGNRNETDNLKKIS